MEESPKSWIFDNRKRPHVSCNENVDFSRYCPGTWVWKFRCNDDSQGSLALNCFHHRRRWFSRALVVLYVSLHSACVSCGVWHYFLTLLTYCPCLFYNSFAVYYLHWVPKMLPLKRLKCDRGIFNGEYQTSTSFWLLLLLYSFSFFCQLKTGIATPIGHKLMFTKLTVGGRDLITPLTNTYADLHIQRVFA